MMEISESLRICTSIEGMTAEIYHALSKLFPEAKDFWYDLALSEENHTNILLAAAGLNRAGILTECIVPSSLPRIRETLGLVRDSKKKVETGSLLLKDAIEIALEIENSTGEIYFQEVLTQQTDSKVVMELRKMLIDEELHNVKIKSFMKSRGL
jgi:rubrerythrin